MVSATMNAQSKEEKEAIKAAEKVLKDAEKTYSMSIPNQQYGRKETNFEKLDGAKNLINQALENEITKKNANTYKVAADIYSEYYKKYENDESNKSLFIDAAAKIVDSSIKYDSLLQLDPKKKPAEKQLINIQYQQKATNPLLQCLSAAQAASNGETQDELKEGKKLSTLVLRAFESNLMSKFENENKADWITYAKAFCAQSIAGIEGSTAADVEAAYQKLMGTKYESVAYSSLLNYYNDRDKAQYLNTLKKAFENHKGENAAQFAFMYMQNLYQTDKAECAKVIEKIIEMYPENDNISNAYLMKGQIAFENKEFEKAEKIFSEAAAKFPDNEAAVTMPAKCAWMKAQNTGVKADREHAIALFKELEAKYPTQPEHWGEALYILYNNNSQNALRDKYKKYYNAY